MSDTSKNPQPQPPPQNQPPAAPTPEAVQVNAKKSGETPHLKPKD